MAGIYFHIPFCKQACLYCDFHFSTSWKYKNEMLQAFLEEMETRKAFIGSEPIETIYFGGGTPSVLDAVEVQRLIDRTLQVFVPSSNMEITLEANPDDLTLEKVKALREITEINRFSIGIQSFFEEDLRWMNRAHSSEEAASCVRRVQDAGFDNITIDLIYGYPLLDTTKWAANIQTAIGLGVPHISAYSMTVESGTALGNQVRKGLEKNMDEDQSANQFEFLQDRLEEAGFVHYEISNWAKPGFEARHNGNYWNGNAYLGIGPSAHSFDGGRIRQWNVRSNSRYIQAVNSGIDTFETEVLTDRERINEVIMTQLRTEKGFDLKGIAAGPHGLEYVGKIMHDAKSFIGNGSLTVENQILKLTRPGKLIADRIASALFFTEDF